MKAVRSALFVTIAAAAWGGSAVTAQEPSVPHPEAEAAIGQLRSPFCPGLMLEVCTSSYAAELRDSIQVLAHSGWRSGELVDWVLAEYGEEWRASPRARGTGLWAWVMPPAVLLLGLVLVLVFLARLRGATQATPATPTPIGVRERTVLDAALREFDESEEGEGLF